MLYTSHSIRPVKWYQVEFNYRWDCETVHTRKRQEDLVTFKFPSILICCCLVICGLFEFHSTQMLYTSHSIRPVKWSQVEFNYRWDCGTVHTRRRQEYMIGQHFDPPHPIRPLQAAIHRIWWSTATTPTRHPPPPRRNHPSTIPLLYLRWMTLLFFSCICTSLRPV